MSLLHLVESAIFIRRYLIYDYFWVTGVNESVLDKADLFSIVLGNDIFQDFEARWDEIVLSMEQFTPDDILESLFKLRIRESEKLNTVLELYHLEIHHKKSKPYCHRLRTMVKRSIEQDLRTRNFEAKNGRIESNNSVKNQREQRHVLKGQGDCWQWKAIGWCSKGNNCSFRHDANKCAKPTILPAPSRTFKFAGCERFSKSEKSRRPKTVWENQSHAMQGPSERVLARILPLKSGIPQSACSTNLRKAANSGISAHSHTSGLRKNMAKGLREVATKVQLLC